MDECGSSPPRYPYLVTKWHDPQSELNGTARLMEDVDMNVVSGVTPGVDREDDIPYLALDTNILINSLNLLKELYSALNSSKQPVIHLLIPSVVINELDGLAQNQDHAGTSIDGDVTVGDLAKNATRWLLDTKRSTSNRERSVLRTQRWAEHQLTELDKPDDKILDCCLYFRARGQAGPREIRLWTNDRNLSLLAESNDIPAIGGPGMTLQRILQAFSVDLSQVWHQVEPDGIDPEDSGMELDTDLQFVSHTPTTPTIFQRTLSGSLVDPLASSSTSSTSSHSTSRNGSTTIPRPVAKIPTSTLTALASILRPVLASLAPSSKTPQDPTTTIRILYDILLMIESQTTGSINEQRYDILRSISALRTILTFLEDKPKGRRPRTGEVAEALELLGGILCNAALLGEEERVSLRDIAGLIRGL